MHHFSDDSLYLNFPDFSEKDEELGRATDGQENFKRMVALKTEYDFENLFRQNQNLPPFG